jgi:hypothetical protein
VLTRKIFQNKELRLNLPSSVAEFSNSGFAGFLEKFLPLPLEAGTRVAATILEVIVAWHRDGVSDGGHDGDVMKRMEGIWRGWGFAERRPCA